MAVKVITDSGSDLPPNLIESLNIIVVPVYLYFGKTAYRDGVDIHHDELYERLAKGPVHPTTTQPMPVDFANTYREVAKEADEIISIHLSTKVSGTVNSALQGREMANVKSKIEIIDSRALSMGLGLLAVHAARLAKAGAKLPEIVNETNQILNQLRLYGVLDTLKYLLAGGRITHTRALLGSLLNVKPILTMRDGEIVQYGIARSFPKGMDKLIELVKKTNNIHEIAIVHGTLPKEADELRKRISTIVKEDSIIMSRLGPALGVHGGPGTLIATFW